MSFSLTHRAIHVIGLEPTEKVMLIALADYANEATGECWPSQSTLAELCNRNRITCNRTIDALCKKRLVAQIGTHGAMIKYKIFPTAEEWEAADAERNIRKQKAHEAAVKGAEKSKETRRQKSVIETEACIAQYTPDCIAHYTPTCIAHDTPACIADDTQTEKKNKEKNKEEKREFKKEAVDSYIQTNAENPSVGVNQLSSGLVDSSSFDWDVISKAAVRQLVTEGFSAAEAEARVKAELEDAKWYVQQRSNDGWKNFNGDRIQHPQKHTIGTLANLARKTKNLPPITRDELTEVVDTNPQVAECLFCGEEEDDFWTFLVCRNFRNGQGETISRWNVQNTIRWFAEFRENLDRRRYGFMRIGA